MIPQKSSEPWEKEKNDIEMQCFSDHEINITERGYQYIINQTISNRTKRDDSVEQGELFVSLVIIRKY